MTPSTTPEVAKQPNGSNAQTFVRFGVNRNHSLRGVVFALSLTVSLVVAGKGLPEPSSTVEGQVTCQKCHVLGTDFRNTSKLLVSGEGQIVPLNATIPANGETVPSPEPKAEGQKVHKNRIVPQEIQDFYDQHPLLWNLGLFCLGFLISYCRH